MLSHKCIYSQRDYDKAEQECQRYKTLYDATKEEVCMCILIHVHLMMYHSVWSVLVACSGEDEAV